MARAPIDSLCGIGKGRVCLGKEIIPWYVKLLTAIILDLGDAGYAIAGWFLTPGVSPEGVVIDSVLTAIGFLLFGPLGLVQGWEIFSPTDVGDSIDGAVPTLTIMGIIYTINLFVQRKKNGGLE